MVNWTNEIDKICLIPYMIRECGSQPVICGVFEVNATTQFKDLYKVVEEQQQLSPHSFTIILLNANAEVVHIHNTNQIILEFPQLDLDLDPNMETQTLRNCFIVEVNKDDIDKCEPIIFQKKYVMKDSIKPKTSIKPIKDAIKPESYYVGLVNQAMTCYLNSLLQALYMTPEFRNALYNWEYIEGSETDETKSIPYQLQKLFLNLQTSTKSAVETTSLTKSFGWNSNEAWQQHDIQELCRVMFDALEQKFLNTEQADLINRLYEGKMIDYVKCLECGTEKSREDTFLDIPLPVRPFGSSIAYNSVEEAMKAFVQYETLEGANQYYCEKCGKKCNAQKGLKFTKFPYLLTLHLKRFDYDYNSCHRIKLNDKVTFPDTLSLNSFISSSTSNSESPSGEEDIGVGVKCDNSSTTDRGTLDDNCPPCDSNLTNSNSLTNHDPGDDEGIDMSNGPSTSNCNKHNHENEKHPNNCVTETEPYVYELFSIMIHSGSASGGHYYAYIKDFRTREWWCFNDQSVTQITQDDIQKTYGGGSTRAYYSGAYSSSTNAYMLMYRQIDPARNALPMQTQDFPRHIQELLKKMKENEDNDKKNREKQITSPKIKVYCHHPVTGNLSYTRLFVMKEYTLAEVTEEAYKKFALNGVVKLNQCRLVTYKPSVDLIECSYEGREQEKIDNIWYIPSHIDLLLEIRKEDQMFEVYQSGGIVTKVFVIDIPKAEVIDGPVNVRGLFTQTVKDYKQALGKVINMEPNEMKLVLRKYSTDIKYIDRDEIELVIAGFSDASNKVFVSTMLDVDSNKPFHETTMYKLIEKFENIISLQVQIPDTSKEMLEELDVTPSPEKYDEKEDKFITRPFITFSKKYVRADDTSTRDLREPEDWNTSEQSNSEDSSLSDSDKTLVGDTQDDDDFPPSCHPTLTDNRRFDIPNQMDICPFDGSVQSSDNDDESKYYFKVTSSTNNTGKLLKVLVDKRMQLGTLKKDLEPYVGVPAEYFRVFRQYGDSESECTSLTERLSVYDDRERLILKLGRALRSEEFKVKVFQLHIDSITEPYKLLCETIVSEDMTFGQVKKQILAEIKKKYNIDIPYEKCRLRKKYYNIPSKVFLDKQKFEDQRSFTQFEMIVQELPDKETVTDSNQVVLFVKKWSPAKVQLGPLQEVVLEEKSIKELRKKISSISNISEKYIDIAKGSGTFPYDIPILKVQNEHQWNENINNVNIYDYFDDGALFLYRDSREELKELSPDERKELMNKEFTRFIHLSSSTGCNRRSEKALKIYLDTK